MTVVRTAVLVDVDGVVNAIRSDRAPAAGQEEHWPPDAWRRVRVWSEDIEASGELHWSIGAIEGLRRIERTPDVEMMWCTTWEHRAATVLAPLVGIGEHWPCLRLSENSDPLCSSFDWWKAAGARKVLQQYKRVVWIDDDIDAWVGTMEMLGRSDAVQWLKDERILTVCPKTEHGLSPHELELIERFLDEALDV